MAKHQKGAEPTQAKERSILIYGNPDKSDLGFPTPGHLTQYITKDIFAKHNDRYRYTQRKNADIIVLSRDGLAYGHFEVEAKLKPNDADRKAYPPVKCVYLIRTSTRYINPVPLSKVSVKNIRFGAKISEAVFQELQVLAGGTENYHNYPSLPQSTVELERVLREVKLRLGQSDFRKGLIAAYNSRCALTGCNAVEALEAAHIKPYSNTESNQASNGLLLRADIHTLFDLYMIGIDPTTLTVALAPVLKKTSYSDLEGKQLAVPTDAAAHPSAHALAERWKRFLGR